MKTITTLAAAAGSGIAVTLVTGVYNSTPQNLLGATWYGLPFAWIYKLVIAPQYNPWKVNPTGLALDLIFWFAISLVALELILRTKKGGRRGR